jgi:tetratricopeptide (TPR) repeat protein
MRAQQQMTVQDALARAMELARSGRAEQASTILNGILATAPDEPDALQLLGMIARGRKENEEAAAYFQRSLKSNPSQPHVFNNLGNALLDLGRLKEAVNAYEAALRLQPSYANALTNLGLAYLALEDAAAARAPLERAVKAAPNNAKAWSALGRALRGTGRTDEAITAFQNSLSLRPNHVPTLHNFAVALRLASQVGDAARILEYCAASDPKSAEIRYNLGHCYYDVGRLDDAASAYEAAITLNPTYRDAHDSLNRLHWQRGDEQYLASYAAALRDHPRNAGLLTDLATRLNLGGQIEQTIDIVQDALRRGVDTGALRHRLGQAYWAQQERDAALSQFRAAIAADPETAEHRLELARSLIIQQEYHGALDELQPVLRRNPVDQQAIAYEALAWRFLGDDRADRLNDYDRFIKASILRPPPQWGSVEDFNRRLEQVLAELHNTSRHPLEQTLRGGTQTMGDLFDRKAPEIVAIREMIEQAVADFIAALPDDPDHIFLNRKAGSFTFSGSWSVRLRSKGFHLNHVHSEGWISSCYYVGLPKAMEREDEQQGWIKFGETGLSLGERERIARAIRPEVGKLILFPSYMYHGTVPFDEDAYRTTIAFDVIPA